MHRYKFAMQRMSLREAQKPEELDDTLNTPGNRRQFGVGNKAPSGLNTDVLVAANYLFDVTSPKGGLKDLLEQHKPLPRRQLRHETLRIDSVFTSPASPTSTVTAASTKSPSPSSSGVNTGEHETKQEAAAAEQDSFSLTINDGTPSVTITPSLIQPDWETTQIKVNDCRLGLFAFILINEMQ
jgi:hypothetical protein